MLIILNREITLKLANSKLRVESTGDDEIISCFSSIRTSLLKSTSSRLNTRFWTSSLKSFSLESSIINLRVFDSKVNPTLCMTGSIISFRLKTMITLGKNSKHKIAVVVVRIRTLMVIYATVGRSPTTFATTTTMQEVITTPYTEIPMY